MTTLTLILTLNDPHDANLIRKYGIEQWQDMLLECFAYRLRSELLALSLPLFRSRLKTILFDNGLVLLGRECL